MSLRSRQIARFSLLAAIALSWAATTDAETLTRQDREKIAQERVEEAMLAEQYGLNDERQRLLNEAVELAPDFAPARWALGQVQVNNEWVAASKVPAQMADDIRITAYENRRMECEEESSAKAHFALARWCEQRGLEAQSRAHLSKTIELDPAHVGARRELGFVFRDGQWIEPEVEQEARDQEQERLQNLAKWRGKIEKIRDGLTHKSLIRKEAARKDLMAINDVEAIPAIEAVLGADSQVTALAAIEALGGMERSDAATSLARFGVLSPWEEVRLAAGKQLAERPYDAYIPDLLGAMALPVSTRVTLGPAPDGKNLLFRHELYREGQDMKERMVLDTEYRRRRMPGGDRRETLNRALTDAQEKFVEREQQVAQQNAVTAEVNQRISDLLATATGIDLLPNPITWWNWWNDFNEVYVPIEGAKEEVDRYEHEEIDVYDETRIPTGITGGGSPGAPSGDCLAPGTIVWTSLGAKEIDRLQVGDLLLAKDPETGEIAYKPVLRTTVRPASDLIRVRAGGYDSSASGGHRFWGSGKGWVRARDLEAGMELHGVRGTTPIESVERTGYSQTYNAIVEDFSSYFVGPCQVLTHDNTVHERTDATVPGLAP